MASPRKERALVREEDAAAFVVRVAVMLTLEGKNPVITAENERWLHRLGGLMLDRFGIGTRETTEENDGHLD
jgi:hypothetical protein